MLYLLLFLFIEVSSLFILLSFFSYSVFNWAFYTILSPLSIFFILLNLFSWLYLSLQLYMLHLLTSIFNQHHIAALIVKVPDGTVFLIPPLHSLWLLSLISLVYKIASLNALLLLFVWINGYLLDQLTGKKINFF